MKNVFCISIMAIILSACSGGGGGGSGSSGSIAQLISTPRLSCGGKNCISGATVSSSSISSKISQSVSAQSNIRITEFKTSYDTIQSTHLFQVKNLINTFHTIADDEGITSCDQIPTSGSYVDGSLSLQFSPSTESWNLDGAGMVSMDRKVYMSDATSDSEINFKCSGSTQYLHVLYKDQSGEQIESFSIINNTTGAIKLQSAYISGTEKSMAYFETDGSDLFELAYFSKGSSSQSSILGKSFKNSTYDLTATELEYVISDVLGEDLDSVNFGDGGTKIRGCVSGYRSSSPTHSDYSCDPDDDPMNPTKYALITSMLNLLGNSGSPAWDTTYLNSLTIADPQQ